MGFSLETSVPAFVVFLQGIISFFSPCVLPLVPLYIGYLAGGTKTVDEHGVIHYQKKKVMLNTLFFVLGISFAFFLLGFGFTTAGRFFSGHRMLFSRIGGVLVIAFGLYQLGVFGSRFLSREHRLPFRLDLVAMNPITALILGFTFSFAWTPCVGPALASVLLMASSANSTVWGFVLIAVYTAGFILPFLAVGLFTGTLLDFFKRHQKGVSYTVKIGGILMILMGIMMLTGWMNGMTGYLSKFTAGSSPSPTVSPVPTTEATPSPAPSKAPERNITPAPNFTLTDQYGNPHALSDYRGKTVFLNFWATWCGPCRKEMPDIEDLYQRYGQNSGDVVILGVANPKTPQSPTNQDVSEEEIKQFLSDGGYTYPTLMDTTGNVLSDYGISAFPTTFMIDKDGTVYGYVSGTLTKSMMEDIIRQTIEGRK